MRDRIYLEPNLSFSVTLQKLWLLSPLLSRCFIFFVVLKILSTPSWSSQKTRRWEIQVAVSLRSFTYTHVWMGAMNHTCDHLITWGQRYDILFSCVFGFLANYPRMFVTFLYSKKLQLIMSRNFGNLCRWIGYFLKF